MLTLALARQSELHWPQPPDWLAPGEQARFAAQGSPARRQQFLAGRWLLRQLLDPGPVDIDAEGRSLRPQGHANLSHSGDWLLAGAAEQAIGVDLEVLRPRADVMGLARQVHSTAQCEELLALPADEALTQFYRGWTLKEAWLKARGQGLDLARLRELHFLTADDGGPCDSACAVLAASGDAADPANVLPALVIAVHQPRGLGELPGQLAGRPLPWQRWRSVGPA